MTTGPLRTPNFKVSSYDSTRTEFEIWGPVGSGVWLCRVGQAGQAGRVNEV